MPYAITVKGTFQHESALATKQDDDDDSDRAVRASARFSKVKRRLISARSSLEPSAADRQATVGPKSGEFKEAFALRDVNLEIPHGTLHLLF